jgi:nucleotide-binding universal stress UspA family protein
MRPIIVGIDFSDCSVNALEHAVSIAQKAQLDIVLLWIKKPDEAEPAFLRSGKNELSRVEEQLMKMVEKYQPMLPDSTVSYHIRIGKVAKEVVAEAAARNAFLIVVGTHGSSGFEEMWIGSNANKIVSNSPCPIVTIRGGVNIGKELKKIVFPIDSTLETRQKVPFTAVMAKLFHAEIHVVLVLTSKVSSIRRQVEEYAEQSIKYFHENKIKYTVEYLQTKNVVDDVIAYATKVDANLISIMTEMETATSNLWLGSYAQQFVNHSPFPVLTLHARETMMGPTV